MKYGLSSLLVSPHSVLEPSTKSELKYSDIHMLGRAYFTESSILLTGGLADDREKAMDAP